MRALILIGWLLVPVVFAFWHYGPGQEQLALDEVSRLLARADRYAARGKWAEAVESYDEALRLLPSGRVGQGRRVRLEKAKAQMLASGLPQAHGDLKTLCEELQNDTSADGGLLSEARSALAQAQYYMTWLMRLEGVPQDVWEPEIEAARQTYRLLAEQAEAGGNGEAARRCREDLESAVRLARMDVGELQGLPLPSQ